MNLKILNIYVIFKYIFIYLMLCMVVNVISERDLQKPFTNIRKKMKPKNIISGPTYTFLKTDKEANIKWGVRHYIPRVSKNQ